MGELNGSAATILYQMGMLTEQGRNTSIRLDRIEAKVDLSASDLTARVTKLETRTATIPRWEKRFKRSASVLVPVASLWLTGHHEQALQALSALLGGTP
jgi:hypothetical protein